MEKLYNVILYNDDCHTEKEVLAILMEVFNINSQKAMRIMLNAEVEDIAVCGIELFEHAEHHRNQLLKYGLKSTLEVFE